MSKNENLVRSNKLTIKVENGIMVATFARTHLVTAIVKSNETKFKPDPKHNATMNRELFRQYMMDNAAKFGILWQPEDQRTVENLVPSRYDSDQLVIDTAVRFVTGDLNAWLAKLNVARNTNYSLKEIVADELRPMVEYKGAPKTPKYANGCWGWASVELTATIVNEAGVESYLSMQPILVSGQLKKPVAIGDNGYHFTGMINELSVDFAELRKEVKVIDAKTVTEGELDDADLVDKEH